MGLGHPRQSVADALADRGRAPLAGIDVQEHVLPGRHRLVLAVAHDRVEQVQPPVVPAKDLGDRLDPVARVQLTEVADVLSTV